LGVDCIATWRRGGRGGGDGAAVLTPLSGIGGRDLTVARAGEPRAPDAAADCFGAELVTVASV